MRNLFAHKLRLLLTGLSVVIGVGFLAGTLVFTDTLKATFNDLIGRTSKNLSVVVRAKSDFSNTDIGASSTRALVPTSLLAGVKATEGVADAVGAVQGNDLLVTECRQGRCAEITWAADPRGVVDAVELRLTCVHSRARAGGRWRGRHRQGRSRCLQLACRRSGNRADPRRAAQSHHRRHRHRGRQQQPGRRRAQRVRSEQRLSR